MESNQNMKSGTIEGCKLNNSKEDLILEIANTPENLKMFSLLVKADKANHDDIGDPLNIVTYTIKSTVIQFQIWGISRFYHLRDEQYLYWLFLNDEDKSILTQWLEKTCIELFNYEIPEYVMLYKLRAMKWYIKEKDKCNYDMGEYVDNSKNPFKIPDEYKYIARDASWFIMQKIGGAIVDIKEDAYLSIWRNIQSINNTGLDEWQNHEPIYGFNMCLYFGIVEFTNGGYGLDGVLNINPSGAFKTFPTFDNCTVYNTVEDAHLAANKYYAKELITLVPEFNIQDVELLNWDCPFYTELDATVDVESTEEGYKVVGKFRMYIDNKTLTTIDTIDSINQGESLYNSIDEALIAAKKFMRQLVVNNLIRLLNKSPTIYLCG